MVEVPGQSNPFKDFLAIFVLNFSFRFFQYLALALKFRI